MQNPSTMSGQPQLGTPVPGTTGGLPALSGLSVTANPMAEELRSYGRGDDTMLVHMTPEEVNSLQGLAMASGGSLTINPHTGLPEAGWLGKLLPTILGVAGAAFGLPTWAIGLGGAAAGTIATGDLGKGLSMGLQAYGGASLAGGLGLGKAGDLALREATKTQAVNWAKGMGTTAPKIPGMVDKFSAFAKAGLPAKLAKYGPTLAGAGLMSGLSSEPKNNLPAYDPNANKFNYVPMAPAKRQFKFYTPEQMEASGGEEFEYVTPSNPAPVPVSSLPYEEQAQYRYAEGGTATTPQSFDELVNYYNAGNPGAITASMKYPVMAEDIGEKQQFKRDVPAIPTVPGMEGAGGIDLSGLNLGNLSNAFPGLQTGAYTGMGNPAIVSPSPALQARLDGGTSRMEDFSNIGNFSTPYTPPRFVQPEGMGINDSVQGLPAMQPTYAQPEYMAPAYEAPVFAAPEILGLYPDVNSSGGSQFGRYENVNEFARGGGVNMRDGAFVVDARTVSELGNGSSNAGMELLSRMGGRPVRGPGDGVSDSVPASIGGKQEARVARDEVIFQPEAVRRIGGGSEKRGTQKLYALMEKAHKARKKAKRGQDTGVRKGLA